MLFDGTMIALYGPILPLPRWSIDVPLLGTVSWGPAVAAAALVVVGFGIVRRQPWARVVGIVVAVAYMALDVAVVVGSGSMLALVGSVVPACVAFALTYRWDGVSPR
jgi:hypothetical protein